MYMIRNVHLVLETPFSVSLRLLAIAQDPSLEGSEAFPANFSIHKDNSSLNELRLHCLGGVSLHLIESHLFWCQINQN